jgi:hypothetical protein
MISSDAKLVAISEYLKRFYEILHKSPFMLGKVNELNTMLYYIDHLSYIVKYGEDFPHELSWTPFLGHKGYLHGDHDFLADAIKSSSDMSLFYKLRAEHAEWFLSKTGREFTVGVST